jgi:Spy/CpxP family protein refolding chaperone
MVTSDIIERLAAHEHEQWAHWTRYMLDNLTEENVARWRQQIEMDYQDLSESEKESDRQWARKAIEVVGILVALSPDENAQKDEV